MLLIIDRCRLHASVAKPRAYNSKQHKQALKPLKAFLLTVSMVSEVRGLAKPNWSSSTMTW